MTVAVPAPELRLAIKYRQTCDLKPDRRNARTHAKRQVEQISASITEFGFSNPILIDPENVIIAGHGRLLAAKKLEIKEVPTITLEGLSDSQKRALRLADNKIALNAGWDMDLLKSELLDLSVEDLTFDISVTGFSVGDIDVILLEDTDPDDEIVPAVPQDPTARLGDIWQLGEHRIGCGDARDLDFLKAVVASDSGVDAAFLDPPYNVRINGHVNVIGRHREFEMASGEMTEDAFCGFLTETLGAAAAVSEIRGGAFCLHGLAAYR